MNPRHIKYMARVISTTMLLALLAGLNPGAVIPAHAAPGDLTRVSVDSSGAQANASSFRSQLSADGRYVAFMSGATNLIPTDTNNAEDIFVKDRQTGVTTRVSVRSNGTEANGGSASPAISGDGHFVAFYSDASNLLNGDTNGFGDIFMHDRQTGQTIRVSVDSSGHEANGQNSDRYLAISGDGRYVAFLSEATNLVSGDTNGVNDIFVHDCQTGQTRRVSVASNGAEANGSSSAVDISDNGRYVAFASAATNLVAGDTNGKRDVFVYDLQTGVTTRVSMNTRGEEADGGSSEPAISGDGRYVVFLSASGNLDPRADEYSSDELVYVHDRQTGQTILVSVDSGGRILTVGLFLQPTISNNGRYVAFSFYDKGDNNGIMNIWARDLQTGTSIPVNYGNDSSFGPSLSADGKVVAFWSGASNLVSGDTNGASDIFVREISSYGPERNPTVASVTPDCGYSTPVCTYPTHDSVSFIVLFSEPVTGVTADDFSLEMLNGITGASITGVSGYGLQYYVTVNTGTGDGKLRLNLVDNDSIQDTNLNPLGGAGTGNGNFTGKQYLIDKNSPIVTSIVRADPNPTAAGTVRFTVTFSEEVFWVRPSDFILTTTGSISGAAVTAISPREDEYIVAKTYTVTVSTGTGDGSLRLDLIDTDSIHDAVSPTPLGGTGTGNGDFTTGEVYTIDRNAPSVPSVTSSLRADANPTDAASVNFNVTFSEAVNGVDLGDFSLATTGSISGALVTNVSGSGNTYTVTVSTGNGAGDLRLDVVDDDSILSVFGSPLGGPGAGNGNFTSGEAYTINRNVPAVVSSLRTDANPTNADTVHFNVTFSEAVNNVDLSDFMPVVTGNITDVFVTEVNGTGNTYTVSVNVGWGDGTLRLDVAAGATITDMDGNPPVGLPYSSGESYSIDNTVPEVASSARASLIDPTNLPRVDFTVTFSEPVQGVDASDFVSGAAVSGGPVVYTVSINTDMGDGYLCLQSHGGTTITDLVGNSLIAGPAMIGESYRIDKTAPILSSSLLASPTNAASVDFTITFSESVTGVDMGDFVLTKTGTISGESVGGVSGGPTVYTVTVNTGTGDGTLRLDLIDNDSVVDLASNPLGGAGSGNGNFTSGETYVIDKAAPVVISILRTDPSPTTASSVHFNVTFSKAVMNVDADDFVLTRTGNISASISDISGSANTYTITVTSTSGTGSGTLRLDLIDNDSIMDSATQPLGGSGAGNGSFTTGEVYTITIAPTIISTSYRSTGFNDGWVLESNENSNAGGSKNSSANFFKLGDDTRDRQFRVVLHFPTYYLPDNAVITQAILMIKKQDAVGTNPFTTHQNISIDIRKGLFSNFSPSKLGSLQVTDYQAAADMYAVGTIQNNPVSGWYWALLDGKAYPYINLTDITQLRLAFQLDDNDDMGDDYIRFYSGDYKSQKDRPHLLIEYYVPR